MQERPAYYQATLTEMLEEPVKRRLGRRTHRGVKRKMGAIRFENEIQDICPHSMSPLALELLK
jgi:hypothetical protein